MRQIISMPQVLMEKFTGDLWEGWYAIELPSKKCCWLVTRNKKDYIVEDIVVRSLFEHLGPL